MPPLLYGAPWQQGDEQPVAYMNDGFEPLAPPAERHDPYLYLGERRIALGDIVWVACNGALPVELQVVRVDRYRARLWVQYPVVLETGFDFPEIELMPGTLLKRPAQEDFEDEQANDG